MNETAPRKRGRPAKPAEERKAHNLTFRTRADFRDRLEQSAAKAGRSVSEEVEMRVERSFEVDRIIRGYNDLSEIFLDNGDTAREFVSSVMAAIATIQETKAKDGRRIGSEDWSSSPATRSGIRICLKALLDHYAPDVSDVELSTLSRSERDDIARVKAFAKISAMMTTGRENEVLDLVVRQDDAAT